jgi:hypothetical protein
LTAVVVSHPHVGAVSVGLADALAREKKLAGYYTGLAFTVDRWPGKLVARVAARAPTLRNRLLSNLPAERLHASGVLEVGARLALTALGRQRHVYNTLFSMHDLAVSMARWPRETTAIYAYEDGARRTFEAARRWSGSGICRSPTT